MILLLLDDVAWDSISQLVDILRPLKKITLLASETGDSLCITKVLGMFQWCINCLTKSLNECESDDDIYIGMEAAVEKLIHYYDNMSPMVGIALALDPSKKLKYLEMGLNWEVHWVNSVKENFQESFAFYQSKMNATPVLIPSKRRLHEVDASWEDELMGNTGGDSPEHQESEDIKYFSLPPRKTHCVLSYWKDKRETYPILAAMAKDYLTVQASSVAAERVFSSGTDLVTPTRCSMKGETIEMTQFLKFNLKK